MVGIRALVFEIFYYQTHRLTEAKTITPPMIVGMVNKAACQCDSDQNGLSLEL